MRDEFSDEELIFHDTYIDVMLSWNIKSKSTINRVQTDNQGNVKPDKLFRIHFLKANVERQCFN